MFSVIERNEAWTFIWRGMCYDFEEAERRRQWGRNKWKGTSGGGAQQLQPEEGRAISRLR